MTKQRRTRKPAKVEEKPTGIILDKKFRLMPLDDQNITLEERVKIGKKPGEKERIMNKIIIRIRKC